MSLVDAFEYVVLPLAAVYGVACVLYAAAPFFLRLFSLVVRR